VLDNWTLGAEHGFAPCDGPIATRPMSAGTAATAFAAGVPGDNTPWWAGQDDGLYLSPGGASLLASCPARLPEPWSKLMPDPQVQRPLAILARQVATPNYETLWFVRLARRQGWQTLILEHRSDRFTVNNATKCNLGRLRVVAGRSRDGRVITQRHKLLDPTAAEGRRLDELRTQSGEGLVDYHHRKLRQVLGADTPAIADMSEAVESWNQGPSAYYVEFFRRLAGPVALFEDFVVDERTARFFGRVVQPAFEQVLSEGQRPQIIKLTPGPQMSSSLWSSYPASIVGD
jgi:hypothetical protein